MSATDSTRPHGYARYRLDGCRCLTCAVAVSTYDRKRAMAITAGTWKPFTDAAPVKEHLAALAAVGVHRKRIEALTGVSRETIASIQGLRSRPATKVRTETAELILSLDPQQTAPAAGTLIDATGSHRRIQALCCIGWTVLDQERLAGRAKGSLQQVLGQDRVTAAMAQAITALYDRLSMTPAPAGRSSTGAKQRAAERGWVPPLEWDDDTIDSPVAVSASEGEAAALQRFAEAFLSAEAEGLSRPQMAARFGMSVHAIKRRVTDVRALGLLPAVELSPCGTRAAYVRHLRRGELADEACRRANAEYQTTSQAVAA
ncbi:hypothetical protein AB0F72_09470 [Actinoplanes sp. NPDC023936]|uniref:hypothetical protein n=1 Tax=Actinoplanes sp. NPDC023936 TaxID=3154910 RepID=UPI003409316F